MVPECLDHRFCCVYSVLWWFNKLQFAIFLCHVCFEGARRLVISDVDLGFESFRCQFSEHIVECSYYQCICHIVDGSCEDVVSIIVVRNKQIVVPV